jgi:hypothetical protein
MGIRPPRACVVAMKSMGRWAGVKCSNIFGYFIDMFVSFGGLATISQI